ncbi:hypothetical protein GGH94_000388 [Coemansia aciculifera]|uniref:Early meiotic induction protein 1 n=1 Tax=Coemansia aciculifera TaxID=417176 RepID=A0A9W8IUN4_9FUNG|nr:hypothetical protein GGH94_000388 [Coemansia aciculifera]KAJ2874285.1 hypothetical protein GGH93_002525 [Coemansia aciculifera]
MTDKPTSETFNWDEVPANNGPIAQEDICKASQAFDQWFACLTVGKQLSNYYRYGEKRGCGKHWSKLKLCMGLKLRSGESRKEILREYREKDEAERDSLPNVLDVWTRRTEPMDGSPASSSSPDSHASAQL